MSNSWLSLVDLLIGMGVLQWVIHDGGVNRLAGADTTVEVEAGNRGMAVADVSALG